MKIDKNVWTDAKCAAFRVEFLTSREELFLYAKALVSGKKLRVIKKASFDDTLITWPNQLLCPLKETV